MGSWRILSRFWKGCAVGTAGGKDEIGNDIVVNSNDDNLHLSSVDLSPKLVEALAKRGVTHLFPIQRAAVEFIAFKDYY